MPLLPGGPQCWLLGAIPYPGSVLLVLRDDQKQDLTSSTGGGATGYSRTKVQVADTLRKMWASLLGMDAADIGLEDGFFTLGGDSLSVVSLFCAFGQSIQEY